MPQTKITASQVIEIIEYRSADLEIASVTSVDSVSRHVKNANAIDVIIDTLEILKALAFLSAKSVYLPEILIQRNTPAKRKPAKFKTNVA